VVDHAVAPPAAATPAPPQKIVKLGNIWRPNGADDDPLMKVEEDRWFRIVELVHTGDMGRARDSAEEFLRLYPYSRYCEAIERLTGVHPRPAIPGE
jgi:hypothetical protein